MFLQLAACWRKICRQDYFLITLLTQSIFLNVFFPFFVIMFLSVEGSDEEKIIIIIYFFINKSPFLHRYLRYNNIRELPADSFKNMDSLQVL